MSFARPFPLLVLSFLFASTALAVEVPAGRRLILGSIHVMVDGNDVTQNCTACFSQTASECLSLANAGQVVSSLPPGVIQLQRVECLNEGGTRAQAFVAKGAVIRVDSREKVGTYFGDLTLTQVPDKGIVYVSKADDQYTKTVGDYHRAEGKVQGWKYVRNLPRVVESPDDLTVVNEAAEAEPKKLRVEGEERNRLKNLYFDVALGYVLGDYGGALQAKSTAVHNFSGFHYGAALDLGVYWPFTDHESLVGLNFRYIRDVYGETGSDATFTILQPALSYHYFLMGKVGDGLFLRGDLGLTRLSVDITSSTNPFIEDAADSTLGLGLALGLGYDFVLNPDLRAGIQVLYNTGSANYEEGARSESWSFSNVLFQAHVVF